MPDGKEGDLGSGDLPPQGLTDEQRARLRIVDARLGVAGEGTSNTNANIRDTEWRASEHGFMWFHTPRN